jgi:N-acetylmuramoyl-L-alanine amidase
MPAVLIETGFINNSEDLKRLMDPSFQDMIVKRIFNAINAYFAMEDPKFQPVYLKINSDQ